MSGKIENLKRKRFSENCDNETTAKRINLANETEATDSSGVGSEFSNSTGDEKNVEKIDFLKEALDKIAELERELSNMDDESEDSGNEEIEDTEQRCTTVDAEALGFAVCARETLSFLAAEGLTRNDPLIRMLRNRLIGKCHGIPI